MTSIVSFNEEKGVVDVYVSTILSLREWLKSIQKIKRLSHQEGCNNVLVDITELVTVPSVFDIFETVSEKLPRNLRYAVVVEVGQAISEDAHFLENVATNRGVQVRLFKRPQDALEWLYGFSS